MSFSQALSGLNAQAQNLKILGNNIANSQTVGFKSSSAIFADVFAGANSQVGLGVKISSVRQDFTAGDLESSGRTLDLAVAGEGFYRVQLTSGETAYTRNGQFSQDNQGYIVNSSGHRLTGYGLSDPDDPFSPVVAGGAPQALQIPADDIPAKATVNVSATYNLNASTVIGQADANTPVQSARIVGGNGDEMDVNYHYSNSYTVYDSLGNSHTVSTYFLKNADNQWIAQVAVDGVIDGFARADGPNGGANMGAVTNYGNNAFAVDFTTGGQLPRNANSEVVAIRPVNGTAVGGAFGNGASLATIGFNPGGGAAPVSFDLDLEGTTQFNNTSIQNTLTQDGYTSGSLAGLEVTRDGRVIRTYTNEERRDAGQIVLASFANNEGLQAIGDNAWRETNASGIGIIGTAGAGVFGTIESGVLENSNVDLAKQLVDTIVAQRAYQANSTSISTQDELLQTIINL
ncbi:MULTISPECIES: flagellar hook protein FlgE [unclassified Halomonas]|uniref:flagellar hook protein FlgE n=1 Tax=unclassified Halomonas TaxID=2609666 RepID=UPI0020A214DD|nr:MULTISPECIES: flagellar hook protein FlgE [unclassified Halomonas]MCP1315093.1 flagellar hook protein FlgE [Halomonas sp. 707D7]MCP1326125.1 flagellar hook protein FlgE [Halomonas sp. 707D4]